jgi:hypothetical protein
MGDECSFCKDDIKKNDQYVIIGRYPGTMTRMVDAGTLIYGLGDLGTVYHKDCYHEKITKLE